VVLKIAHTGFVGFSCFFSAAGFAALFGVSTASCFSRPAIVSAACLNFSSARAVAVFAAFKRRYELTQVRPLTIPALMCLGVSLFAVVALLQLVLPEIPYDVALVAELVPERVGDVRHDRREREHGDLEALVHDGAAKAVALGRSGDLQGAISFSDAAIEERGDTPYIWLARADVLLARSEARADYCFEKALLLAPLDWFTAWLAARIRFYYEQFALALKLIQQAVEWNPGHFLLWLEQGRCQQALNLEGAAENSYRQARELNRDCVEAGSALIAVSQTGCFRRFCGRLRQLFQR